NRILAELHEALIFAIEQPAVADRDDGLSLVANRLEVSDQILKRLERGTFPLARDHLARERGFRSRLSPKQRIARDVALLCLVEDDAVPHAPRPVTPQLLLHHFRLPAQRNLRWVHFRRHDADE